MTLSAVTAWLSTTGAHAASVVRAPQEGADDPNQAVGTAHAVARPVVDGLDQSVCGVLVTVIADLDWSAVPDVPRCQECQRIAG